jgi:predicted transcriptional regulator
MSGNRFYPRPTTDKDWQRGTRATNTSVRYQKSAKQMERHLKGIANHRRIEILFLVANDEGISVEGISGALKCNFKTISEHVRRLVLAGLVDKKYEGRHIIHKLTPYGRTFISFLTTFSHS